MRIAMMLHVLGVVVWVGGMFFAYLALRPAAAKLLEPPQRLSLWSATLTRFFAWVWLSVVFILGSGFYMVSVITQVGTLPIYVHAMLYIGIAMTLIFGYVFSAPFTALKRAVTDEDWRVGGRALNQIRMAVGVNLMLGLLNVVVATLGAV